MNQIRFHSSGDVTVKAGHELRERSIPDYEVVFFPLGTDTVYTVEGVPEVLSSPCVIMTRPGESHNYRFDPRKPTRHLFIHFDCREAALVDRFTLLNSTRIHQVKLQDYSIVPVIMNQLLLYFHRRPDAWKRLSESLFLALLEELESLIQPDPKLTSELMLPLQIDTALQYIDEHMTEKIDIFALADQVGWSHEHFTRMFQQHTGYSPKKWITKRRIDLATQLLLRRTDSIKSIAKSIGFTDEYYFHRLFARQMGMTATEYRRSYADKRVQELAPPEAHGRFYPLNHFFSLEQRENK